MPARMITKPETMSSTGGLDTNIQPSPFHDAFGGSWLRAEEAMTNNLW
jgi:hypothetical protein